MASPRILIVRTSALGDIVHALPVLSALRREFATSTIGWVVEEAFAPLLSDHPLLDEILPVRLRPWRTQLHRAITWRQIGQFLGRLNAFAPEIVIDLMGNHKAGAISALSLADRRLGLRSSDRREPSSAVWISEPVPARGAHAVERMLSVLDGLGIENLPADFAASALPEQPPPRIELPSRFVLLHPCTGWSNKDFPPHRWATVARRLSREGAEVLLAPGPGEELTAERIAARAEGSARVLAPSGLPELVFLQRRAALVIGGDTGPVHLAHALGTPVVCVMGPTDPNRHGPYGAPGRAVFQRLPCSYCHKRLDGARACILAIDPQAIVARALAALRGDALH